MHSIADLTFLKDKRVLITGGTGSFGQACAAKILKEADPQALIIFSRDERKQWVMQQDEPLFKSPKMRYFLGDVRDKERLMRAFKDVDIVIHAAALKQVPAAEYNPTEFVRTNVLGAMNISDAAIDCDVEKVIALSTDKAVNPTTLYGATKLCADKIFIAANSYVGSKKKPIFSIVRYGNVLGTRGSIISLWKKQTAVPGARITVTDREMTRFWITVEQAITFVLKTVQDARGGEIYIPKMASMKIIDMAKALYPHQEMEFIGIREGEKMHELLVNSTDARHTLAFKDHFVILPQIYQHKTEALNYLLKDRQYETLPANFSYASDTNTCWLNRETLLEMLKIL
jgi:UDP-N-acetylglucosamine 4,6-dehydratase/5-epimerase